MTERKCPHFSKYLNYFQAFKASVGAYLEQLVSTEQLATAADRSLRKYGADVVMPTVCFQTDAQTTTLAKLLHLSHLSGKNKTHLVKQHVS